MYNIFFHVDEIRFSVDLERTVFLFPIRNSRFPVDLNKTDLSVPAAGTLFLLGP
jgi:hypothetical protein